MQFLKKLGITKQNAQIDWNITPAKTYGMFECRGDMDIVRSKDQRFYYFFIDNWQKSPKLCLMERGIRHAVIKALIDAPQHLLEQCIARQGKTLKEHSYAIDEEVRDWIVKNVIDSGNFSRVHLLNQEQEEDCSDTGLPGLHEPHPQLPAVTLRSSPKYIDESEIVDIVTRQNFFEALYNPGGQFAKYLVDNLDYQTVTDKITGLIWQRKGSDHSSFRQAQKWIEKINQSDFAGYSDWRLPTVEEALSLLNQETNEKGFHIHSCFATMQGYIYTADRRKPGGFWFVDLRHARVFWAGGTLSGGFSRLCRTV